MLNDIDATLEGQRVVVVGGGVFGTMHAFFALARGASVVHFERDPVPSGATVRNFGLVWVSGRAVGRELSLALRARALWEDIARDVPDIGFRPNGSITLINNDQELHVAELAMRRSDAEVREFELLSPEEIVQRNPALRGEFMSGLYCVATRQSSHAWPSARFARTWKALVATSSFPGANSWVSWTTRPSIIAACTTPVITSSSVSGRR